MADSIDDFTRPNAYADSIRNNAKTLAWLAVSDHGTAADALMDLLNDVDADMAAEADGSADAEHAQSTVAFGGLARRCSEGR